MADIKIETTVIRSCCASSKNIRTDLFLTHLARFIVFNFFGDERIDRAEIMLEIREYSALVEAYSCTIKYSSYIKFTLYLYARRLLQSAVISIEMNS